MTLLYHFPIQETSQTSTLKGTKYTKDAKDETFASTVSLSADKEDSSTPVSFGLTVPTNPSDVTVSVSLTGLVAFGNIAFSITDTLLEQFAYVSSFDSGNISLTGTPNDNPCFGTSTQVNVSGGLSLHIYIFSYEGIWYYAPYSNPTRLSVDASYIVSATRLPTSIETIQFIGTHFPSLNQGTQSIKFNHDLFRVENLLARNVTSLNGSFDISSVACISFWALVNNFWSLVTFSSSTWKINNVEDTSSAFDIFQQQDGSFTIEFTSETRILDLRFHSDSPSFLDLFKHPKTPSFGFFQLAHSSGVGIAGNQIDDTLTFFKNGSTNQEPLLADIRAHSLTLGNTNILDTINNIDLTKTSQLTIATFDSDDSISSYGSLSAGQATFNGNLSSTGNTTLKGTLVLKNDSNLYGSITAGQATFNGNTTLKGTLELKNDSNVYGSITAGQATFNGNISSSGNTTVNGTISSSGSGSGKYATIGHDTSSGYLSLDGSTVLRAGGHGSGSTIGTSLALQNGNTKYSLTASYANFTSTTATTFAVAPKVGNNDVAVTNTSATFSGLTVNGTTTFTTTPTVNNVTVALSNHTHGDLLTKNDPSFTGTLKLRDLYSHYRDAMSYYHDSYLNRHYLSIGTGFTNTVISNLFNSSDDRLKLNEKTISDANVLLKLRPQVYDKLPELHGDPSKTQIESGLIAQEIWYDCPELRHLVSVGPGGKPADAVPTSDDPSVDPDYSSWGDSPATVNYIGLIPYLIRGFQESHAVIESQKAQIALLMKACGLTDSGNVESA